MTDAWAKLCKDRPCIGCGADDGTIVPAHANEIMLGKGMGLKALPWTQVPLCMRCHAELDNGQADRETLRAQWRTYWVAHMFGLLQADLVQVAGNVPRGTQHKPISKILPRVEYRR